MRSSLRILGIMKRKNFCVNGGTLCLLLALCTFDNSHAGDVIEAVSHTRCHKAPPTVSRCRAAKPAYYYDKNLRRCQSFLYGGCPGDEAAPLAMDQLNLFQDIEDCKQTCGVDNCPIALCLMECANGYKNDDNGCPICECNPPGRLVPCPLISCTDVCLNGHETDANGCETCVCKNIHNQPVAACQLRACTNICAEYALDRKGCPTCECKNSSPPGLAPCPNIACADSCPNGYELDSKGCQTCDCKKSTQPDLAACPAIACADSCPNGYTLDSKGCQTCVCKVSPTSPPSACPAIECDDRCPRGYELDAQGCQTCRCIKPSLACPRGPRCMMFCPYDFMLDQNGCPKCACASEPEKEALPEEECGLMACRMFCPLGFRKDRRGCQICQCADDPCEAVSCEAYETCVKDESNFLQPKCVRTLAPMDCPEALCSMYCEHGFSTDIYGCPECRCRTSRYGDRVYPQVCPNKCFFGYAYDSYGIPTCDCLPNGCEKKKCSLGETCVAQARKDCPLCPLASKCVGKFEVNRALVNITYRHSSHSSVPSDTPERYILQSISGLVEPYFGKIQRVTLNSEPRFNYVVASFNLTLDKNSFNSLSEVYSRLYDVIKSGERSETRVKFHWVTYTPIPNSMTAVYFADEESDVEVEVAKEEGFGIMMAVVAAVITFTLLSLIAACTIMICRRIYYRRRARAIYKPVDSSVHM